MEQEKKVFPPLPDSDDEEPFVYHHRVETCSCGICSIARYHRDTWEKPR